MILKNFFSLNFEEKFQKFSLNPVRFTINNTRNNLRTNFLLSFFFFFFTIKNEKNIATSPRNKSIIFVTEYRDFSKRFESRTIKGERGSFSSTTLSKQITVENGDRRLSNGQSAINARKFGIR